jgi:Sec-independent protein translocase protein TatA
MELVNAFIALISMVFSLAVLAVFVLALLGPHRIRRMSRRVAGAASAIRETHAEFRATRAEKPESTEPVESLEPVATEEYVADAAPQTTVTPEQAQWAYYDQPTYSRRHNNDGVRLQ